MRGLTGSARDVSVYRKLAGATAVLVTIVMLVVAVAEPESIARALRNVVVVDGMAIATLWLAGRGHVRAASWIYLSTLVLLITFNAIPFGGIRSPGVPAFVVFVVMAGLLLGERVGILVAGVCAALGLGLVVAEQAGWLPAHPGDYTSVVRWLLICMYMGIGLLALYLATGRVEQALGDAQRELVERRQAEAERERLLQHLDERVKELRLMHDASRLLRHASGVERLLLQELVARMPEAWQHADDAAARAAFGRIEATSPGWQETPWTQTAAFSTSEGEGVLEVAYRHEHPSANEGPFLAEERSLLDSLADMLRTHIERHAVERERQIVEAQLRQAQKMEAVGRLAGGIAHDFNNILTAIGGNAQLAALDAPPDSQLGESIQEILKAHARASDMVRRILVFGRHQESSKEVMPVEPVIEEALQLLRTTLPRDIEIRTRVAPHLPSIRADATQMHQLVMNLGTNAAYAMRERGGVLAVSLDVTDTTTAAVLSPQLAAGRYLRLAVADTGVGMSAEVRERVFEPFFTTKGSAGTGLGLSVVHGIIREHGGAITVTSEPGAGTEFVVYLPAEDSPSVDTSGRDTRLAHGTGQHIMYIDDESSLCHFMSRTLGRLGYRVTTFTDPALALHEFRSAPHAFDAVVTDLQMPAMSGLDVARAVRAVRTDTPVAIASGYPAEHIITDPDVHSMTWITKPVSLEELAATLRGLLPAGGDARRSPA